MPCPPEPTRFASSIASHAARRRGGHCALRWRFATSSAGPAPLLSSKTECRWWQTRREPPVEASPWIVAIGASGQAGLEDIAKLLATLPVPFGGIVMVVLHRPWNQPTNLRAILQRACDHPVVIAGQEQRLQLGSVYIGAPSEHLTLIEKGFGTIVDDPDRDHGNRTVDLLFRSVAEHARGRMIGVVLSGSLDDGSRGLATIHHAGGLTMVMGPMRTTTPGMPENAIAYDGAIDVIGSPEEIAAAIVSAVR